MWRKGKNSDKTEDGENIIKKMSKTIKKMATETKEMKKIRRQRKRRRK